MTTGRTRAAHFRRTSAHSASCLLGPGPATRTRIDEIYNFIAAIVIFELPPVDESESEQSSFTGAMRREIVKNLIRKFARAQEVSDESPGCIGTAAGAVIDDGFCSTEWHRASVKSEGGF